MFIRRLILLLMSAIVYVSAGDVYLTIDGNETTAECKLTHQAKPFSVHYWADGCPFPTRNSLYNWLIRKPDYYQSLPTCDAPQEPLPTPMPKHLGLELSQDLPDGYELVDENITNVKQITYGAYNGASTAYTNITNMHGWCRGLSASFSWNADEYQGIIKAKHFTRKYKKICTDPDTDFPNLANNERVLFKWKQDNNRSAECLAIPAFVQEKRVECEMEYRCVHDSVPECPRDVPVGSYVSPTAGVFQEDIELMGSDIALHYQSGFFKNASIAKGWSLNIHHTLIGEYLYLGDGEILNITSYKTQENNTTTLHIKNKNYIFDANNTHILTLNAYNKKVIYRFNYTENRLHSIVDTYGNELTLNRDANGTVVSIVGSGGQINYVDVDANGDMVSLRYEDDSKYKFEYEDHLMIGEIEPNGNEFIHEYDALGKVVRVIDAEDGVWNFSKSTKPEYSETLVHKAAGDTVEYRDYFMKNAQLISETILPSGDIYKNISDLNYTQSQTDRCGVQTLVTYAPTRDEVTQERYIQSVVKNMPSGLSKNILYARAYVFDATGNVVSKENSVTINGALTKYVRDYENYTMSVRSAEGRVSKVEYDTENVLPRKIKIAGLKPVEYKYDKNGRVVKIKQGKRALEYVYDERGNLIQEINKKEKKITKYLYDNKDRVIQMTLPNGYSISYSYDANTNMTKLTTPTPTEHTFTYNGVNKRVSMNSPLGYETLYVYDKQRRVTEIRRASGKSIHKNYESGELQSITTPEGTIHYKYSCASKVASVFDDTQSINYSYDGELLTQLQMQGMINQTLTYAYNNDFRVASTTYAGVTNSYSYDKDGYLISSGPFTLNRDKKSGALKSVSDGVLQQEYKYNEYGELKELKNKSYKLTLKRKHTQITQKEEEVKYRKEQRENKKEKKRGSKEKHHSKEQHHKKTTYKYKYDRQGRLVSVSKNKKEVEHYTYDANSNRLKAKVYGVTTQAYYTLDDQVEVYGDNTYKYDTDGYLIEKTTPKGVTTYTYNTLGALTDVITPTTNIHYHLNPLNQRVAKEVDGVITEKYLWRDLTTLLAVYDKDDNLFQRFNYADNRMPISMTMNSETYYLHYDQVGTLRAVTDANKNIIKEITYDTFGNILQDTNKNFKVPFGFAGGLADRDTNLVHFGYREYDSYTGKWTAKDPIDFAGGDSNLYGYVLGDPVDLVDVEGLAPSTILPFIPVGIGIVMYTYNQFTDMANGADYASNLKVCSDIIAQYDFLIDNVDNMCMSDMEKSIYQLQLNEEKNKLFLECLQVIGKN